MRAGQQLRHVELADTALAIVVCKNGLAEEGLRFLRTPAGFAAPASNSLLQQPFQVKPAHVHLYPAVGGFGPLVARTIPI